MNTRDEAAELGSLLRSRFPIILIESHEEPRILELLKKACNLENQVLMTWSITSGIRRHGRDEAVHQTNDLLDALKQCDGDRNAVGRLLSVERNTLRYKLNKYDLLDK